MPRRTDQARHRRRISQPRPRRRSGGPQSALKASRRKPSTNITRGPRKGDVKLTDAGADFYEASEEIMMVYKKAKFHKGGTPYESPLGEFKRRAYSFLRPYIHSSGGQKIINNVLDHLAVSERRRSYDGNPFYIGLLALDEDGDLTSSDVSRFAKQMLYADINDVPACLLVGFIYQIGGPSKIAQKLADRSREPWTKEEVKASFASSEDHDR